MATYDLRDGRCRKVDVPWVLSLRAVGQEELLAHLEAAACQHRQEDLVRGARVGRRLQHHELPSAKALVDRGQGLFDVAQVRLATDRERGRDADQQRIGLPEARKIRGGLKIAAGHGRADGLCRDVANVRTPRHQLVDLGRVDVVADDGKAGVPECQDQRQPDVAEPYDPDDRVAALDLLTKLLPHGPDHLDRSRF